MTNTAQQAYEAHVSAQKANWHTMTTEQQDASLRTERTLQLAAEDEAAANAAELQQQAQYEQNATRQAAIAEMISNGYSGTGSLDDFKKLFRSSVFGPTHEKKAIDAFNAGEDIVNIYLQTKNA